MIKKYGLAFASITALMLMGVGCSDGKIVQPISFEKTAGVAVTDTVDNKKVLESYVTKTFGEAAVTGLMNDQLGPGSTNIEYKVSRSAEQRDVAALESMLKKKGFEAYSTLVEGDYVVSAKNKTHIIVFTLTIGETKIEAFIMPSAEDEE